MVAVLFSTSAPIAPEAQNDFLGYILEFERQFENAQRISVRDRIGNPTIKPVEEIPLDALEEAVDGMLFRLPCWMIC